MPRERKKLSPADCRAAVEMRRAGLYFIQIAQQLGISRKRASAVVNRQMVSRREEARETAATALGLELERLDAALRVAVAVMNQPGAPAGQRLRAIDRVLKIKHVRCRLLNLYAPANVAPTTSDGSRAYTPPEPRTDSDRLQKIQALLGLSGAA
jgi:hypothetical protein